MRLTCLTLILATLPAFLVAGQADDLPPENQAEAAAVDLSGVQDETPGIRPEEQEAWRRLQEEARTLDPSALKAAAQEWAAQRKADYAASPGGDVVEFSLYFDLVRNPDRYRGRAVQFNGRLRELRELPADEGFDGEEGLYEAIITTGDNRENPLRVITASVPDELPRGTDLAVPVSVLGRFFKLQTRDRGEQSEIFPLIAAGEIEWTRGRDPQTVRLDPALWADVEDRAGLREYDFYYFLLKHAGEVPYEAQQAAAREHLAERRRAFAADPKNARREFSAFADVFLNPEAYRGETVTLRGHIRRIIPYEADENDYGVEQLYEIWMFAEDAGTNPVVIISRTIPKDMPTPSDRDPVDNVTVTGYFFKLYVYTAEDAKRLAPMILAQRIDWAPVEVAGVPNWLKWSGLTALAILGVAVIMFLWQASRSDRNFRAARAREEEPPQDSIDFSSLPSGEEGGFPTSDDFSRPNSAEVE